jgi:hypothetical protein
MAKVSDSADWVLLDQIQIEFKSGFLSKYGVTALVNLCNRREKKNVKLALSDDGKTQLQVFVKKSK